jgi:hypothetical protein
LPQVRLWYDAFKSGEGAVAAIDKAASAGGEICKTISISKVRWQCWFINRSGQTAQLGFTACSRYSSKSNVEMIYKSPNF